jgi:hypothetical protein
LQPLFEARLARQHKKIIAWAESKLAKAESDPAKPRKITLEELQRVIAEDLSPQIIAALEKGLTDGGKQMEDLLGVKFNAKDPRVLDFIKEKEIKLAGDIDEATVEAVRGSIETGYKNGETEAAIIKRVVESGQFSEGRAQRIARTEAHSSILTGAHEGMRQGGVTEREWLAASDEKTRDTHREADGQKVGIDEKYEVGDAELAYPGDPNGPPEEIINCFHPDTIIQGRALVASRFRYAGPMREIVTRSGKRLSVTPNHPVLTPQGFVPAKALLEGQDVLSYGSVGERRVAPGIEAYNQHGPIKIEKAFDAIRTAGGLSPRKVRADDFHGDAAFGQGDVEVAILDWKLLLDAKTKRAKSERESVLVGSAMSKADEACSGTGDPAGHRIGAAPASGPSAGALAADSGGIGFHPAPLEGFRFGPAAQLDICRCETAEEQGAGYPSLARELIRRSTGEIKADQVVEVRDFFFTGHVFDLQTETGWIIANGIFSSNCRCTELIIRAEVSPEDFADALEMLGNKAAQEEARDAIKADFEDYETSRMKADDVEPLEVKRGTGKQADYDSDEATLTIGPKATNPDIADGVREHIVASVTTKTDARNFFNEVGTGKLPEPAGTGGERAQAVRAIAKIVAGDRKGLEALIGEKLSDAEWKQYQVIGKHYYASAGSTGKTPAKEKR